MNTDNFPSNIAYRSFKALPERADDELYCFDMSGYCYYTVKRDDVPEEALRELDNEAAAMADCRIYSYDMYDLSDAAAAYLDEEDNKLTARLVCDIAKQALEKLEEAYSVPGQCGQFDKIWRAMNILEEITDDEC